MLWGSGMPGSPIFPVQNLTGAPSMLTMDTPRQGAPCEPSHHSSQKLVSLPPGPPRSVSIEPLTDQSKLSDFFDSGVPDGGFGGTPPGGQKRKRPLSDGDRKRRQDRHKKQRATNTAKAKRRERRKAARSNKPPTERKPRFPRGLNLPQPIASGIRPLSRFPVVSTGYTGDKGVKPILEGHMWTLEELVEAGLEVVEWDGR
jgi:hypothetical protein